MLHLVTMKTGATPFLHWTLYINFFLCGYAAVYLTLSFSSSYVFLSC